jgi:membrane protein implicated in regulation of membrane protease activity
MDKEKVETVIGSVFVGLPAVSIMVFDVVEWVPVWVPLAVSLVCSVWAVSSWLFFVDQYQDEKEENKELERELKGFKGIVKQLDQEIEQVSFTEIGEGKYSWIEEYRMEVQD